ncbi:MAG: hypothetical protein EA425_15085, partial [Puniceicoccaceae bacterium]
MLLLAFLAGSPLLASSWRAEADRRIDAHRRGELVVDFSAREGAGAAPAGSVRIELLRHHFDFGAAVNTTFLAEESPRGEAYRRFLEEHVNALVAENAMKWYALQPEPGPRLWTEADQFLDFAAERGLRVRGHTLFWSKAHWVQDWVHELGPEALRAVVEDHLRSVVQRYAGRLTGWDVNNEMMTGSFFLDRLGPEIRPWMYRETRRLDPGVPLFLNEYGLL